MNSDFQPPHVLPTVTNNGVVKPTTLNKFSSAINRLTNGVRYPQVRPADAGAQPLTNPVALVKVVAVAQRATTGLGNIDGTALAADDLVLLQNQTTNTENGIWIASSTAWVNVTSDPAPYIVAVTNGSNFANTLWILDKPNPNTYALAGSSGPIQMSVVALQADYVQVHPFVNGVVDPSQTINVALPYLLRKTPFNGNTVNSVHYVYTSNSQRTATQGATTETQLITQDYYATSLIYAMPISLPVTVTISGSPVKLYLVDMNTDARAWAKQ